jgi:hypothetical protein
MIVFLALETLLASPPEVVYLRPPTRIMMREATPTIILRMFMTVLITLVIDGLPAGDAQAVLPLMA